MTEINLFLSTLNRYERERERDRPLHVANHVKIPNIE